MYDEGALPTPVEEPTRLRVCSLSGIVGTSLILVGFFLPWVQVTPAFGRAFQKRFEARLDDPARPPPPAAEDWRRLGRILGEQGEVSGLDVFYWARTALRMPDADATEPMAVRRRRALHVTLGWLAALPVLSFLLLVYFLLHHCQRARSPALVMATLVGAAATVTVVIYDILRGPLTDATRAAPGLSVLLAGGAVLFLAGTFGVKARNWWRVFGGALLLGGAIALGLQTYLSV